MKHLELTRLKRLEMVSRLLLSGLFPVELSRRVGIEKDHSQIAVIALQEARSDKNAGKSFEEVFDLTAERESRIYARFPHVCSFITARNNCENRSNN